MQYKVKAPTVIKVDLYGEIIDLKKPTMGQQIALENDIKKASDDSKSVLEVMVEWVVGLGMKREQALKIEQDSFHDLITFLVNSKKN